MDDVPARANTSPLPLWQHAAWHPHRPALLTTNQAWTFADLAAEAERWAGELAVRGLRRGDILGSWLDASVDAVLALQAAWRIGAAVCPFNTRLSEAEFQDQCARVAPRLLLARAFAPDDPRAQVPPQPGPGGTLAVITDLVPAPLPVALPRPPENGGIAADDAGPDDDDPAALLFTSGSTGRPKAAVLSHGAMRAHAAASALRLGCMPDDLWLAPLPLFHVGGLAIVVRSALAGTAIALSASGRAQDIAAALDRWPISLVSLVPTQLRLLLDAWPGPAPRSLRAVLLGGSAADPQLLREARARGWPIAASYGLTEAGSQVATGWPSTDPEDPSEGWAPPLAFTRLEIRDPLGRVLPTGQEGDIWVRGPGLMRGYLDDPASTAASLVDGWLRTGDIGMVDSAGRLRVVSRREDLIVSGGENVYPTEVETVLRGYPGLKDVCVVGIPDAQWGEVVCAAIVAAEQDPERSARADASEEASALEAWLQGRLAGYKRPRRYLAMPELPLTASGKVSRSAVKQAFTEAAAQTQDEPSVADCVKRSTSGRG